MGIADAIDDADLSAHVRATQARRNMADEMVATGSLVFETKLFKVYVKEFDEGKSIQVYVAPVREGSIKRWVSSMVGLLHADSHNSIAE